MSATVLTYISLAVSILALILGIYAIVTTGKSRAWRKFFNSQNEPENFDDVIDQLVGKLELLETNGNSTAVTLESVANQLNKATQHVGIVRYNGTGDDGGNLSFSAALLDAHQTGIVITSLHGRQQNRIYAKVITSGASENTLSEEEREALMQALTNNLDK